MDGRLDLRSGFRSIARSGRPAVRVDFDLGAAGRRGSKAEGDRQQTRLSDIGVVESPTCRRVSNGPSLPAVKLERPGIAVDEQEFADADLGVEVELLAGAVAPADDLDGEVGAAE